MSDSIELGTGALLEIYVDGALIGTRRTTPAEELERAMQRARKAHDIAREHPDWDYTSVLYGALEALVKAVAAVQTVEGASE